jgi:hypothetical protein
LVHLTLLLLRLVPLAQLLLLLLGLLAHLLAPLWLMF